MVKNNKGGNKSKRVGRKFLSASADKSVRYKNEEGEMYIVISKLFGGENCEVFCEDGTTRLCVIRKKFRGRGKQDNKIVPGVWALAGVREWEVRKAGKPSKCDLLCVYNDSEKEKLKNCLDQHTVKLLNKISGNMEFGEEDKYENSVEFIMSDEFENKASITREIRATHVDKQETINKMKQELIDINDL
jgi:initiation factor 1A